MTSRLLLLPFTVALALGGTVGCVDETGYEPCPMCVDETGYLKPDRVFYTADTILDDAARAVVVLGLSEALCPPGGTLVVEGPDGAVLDVPPPTPEGGFRLDVDARAGDVVTFRYTPPDEEEGFDTFTLGDALTDVDAPGAPGTSSVPYVAASASTGELTVDPSVLSSGDPPFLVYVRGASTPPALSENGEPVTLQGGDGDEVCIFSVRPDDGTQSPHYCEIVAG